MADSFKRLLLVSALVSMAAPCAVLAEEVFFGEDLGVDEWTPLASWPNADAANAQFLSRLTGVTIESFEGFPYGTILPGPLAFGSVTATLEAPPDAYQPIVDEVPVGQTNGVGRYATDGTKFLETSSEFSITFSEEQVAFGFFGIDVGDFDGELTLETMDGTVKSYVIPHTVSSPGGTVIFWGVISPEDPFVSVAFGTTAPAVDYFGFDEWTIGNVTQVLPGVDGIPTVSEWGMVIMALLLVTGGRVYFSRRRAIV